MRFIFTKGFLDGPPAADTAAPRLKARLNMRHLQLFRVLQAVEKGCRSSRVLHWSHLQEAGHVRRDYWPPEFGAFLAGLYGGMRFSDIKGLNDPDPDGYVAGYRSERFDLDCAVIFTEKPQARMAFLSVGTPVECRKLLKQFQKPDQAKAVIGQIRRL